MIRTALALATVGILSPAQLAYAQEPAEEDPSFGASHHRVESLLEDANVALSILSAGALCNPIIADSETRALRREYERLWEQAKVLLGRDPMLFDLALYHCHRRNDVTYDRAQRLKQRASQALKRIAALLRRGRLD